MSTYKYDFVIVGAGLFGSIFARELTDAGAKCLVLDKRSHIGGNCYTRNEGGIQVHQYGAHIFHTNDTGVWNYINKFVEFNNYKHTLRSRYKDNMYSFPINMMTLHQLWGVKTPEEAKLKLDSVKLDIKSPSNLEEWALSQIGEEIYNIFIRGYTTKQWNCDPKDLPASIIKRIPIRLTYNDTYFADKYQGIPIGGYTQIFEKLLKDIPVEIGVDYLDHKEEFEKLGKRIVYTGGIDELFNYNLGVLGWRSLKFDEEEHQGDYQGAAVVNYNEESVPYTRICEHKHFEFQEHDHTIITKEYPQDWKKGKEKIYPVNTEENNNLYKQYRSQVDCEKYILGGRLATYKYYDMHQVIGSALHHCNAMSHHIAIK